MQIWNLPDSFQQYEQRITSGVGIEVIHYQNAHEIEKANVQLDSNLLVLLLAGKKEVYAPEKKMRLQTGEGFFLSKGNYLMSEKFAEINRYESLMVFFDDQIAQQLSLMMLKNTGQPIESQRINSIKVASSEHTITFAKSLKNYFHQPLPVGFDEILKLKLQELFWLLCQGSDGSRFLSFLKNLQNKKALTLQQLMEEHYKEALSVEKLAFLSGYSLSTFKRKFKEIFQESPSRWVQTRRLKEARFLLQNTQKNINEVGYEVGFENISHFIQVFKGQYGATPKEFQQQT
ncbi:MAG TPA: hypothetical protein DCS93_24305 [Microscillaceae bacterium]|nr:hypothetical protein [Microscillaceae bacterium]